MRKIDNPFIGVNLHLSGLLFNDTHTVFNFTWNLQIVVLSETYKFHFHTELGLQFKMETTASASTLNLYISVPLGTNPVL